MTKKQFKNERTCIVCKEKDDKLNLVRFVLDENLNVLLDKKQCFKGRGAYIHEKKDCLKALTIEKNIIRAFRRAFRLSKDSKINIDDKLKFDL